MVVSARGNTISEKSMMIVNNHNGTEGNSTLKANVAGGIGIIGFDFKGFSHYDTGTSNPSNNYYMGTLDSFSETYEVTQGQYTVFHVVFINWDPANETMYLDSSSAIYFVGNHSYTVKYNTWPIVNVTGNDDIGYSLNLSYPVKYVLPPGEPVDVFFGGTGEERGQHR